MICNNLDRINPSICLNEAGVVGCDPAPLVSRIKGVITLFFQWISTLFESIGLRRVSNHQEPVASENSFKDGDNTFQKRMLQVILGSIYLGLVYYHFKPEIDATWEVASRYLSQQLFLAPSPTAEYLVECASYAPENELGYAQGVLECAKKGFNTLSEDTQNGEKFLRKLAARFHPDHGGDLEATRILLTALQTLRKAGSFL